MNLSKLFPDERLKGETDLRKAQLVMLRMLKIFDYLCRKNNIRYWLDYGTLLGAVRHKGFIPWDADIDVGMIREDYNKFRETCVSELPRDIFFQTTETDSYYPPDIIPEAKLRDKYSNYIKWQEQNPNMKWHNGIQLDMLIYDKWLSKIKPIFEMQRRILIRSFLFHKFLKIFYKFIKVQHYAMAHGIVFGFFEKEDIFPLKTMEFEGHPMMVPRNFDKYLKDRYGDYMKLPPVNERHSHEGKIDLFKPCNHKEIIYWDKEEKIYEAS